ncbi:MAG: PAS domain S-box protein, partial [Alphaproteobacteria bacterium]
MVKPGPQSPIESETKLRAILDTAVDAIITIDETGTIEDVNPAVEGIFGYAASELLGRNVDMLMPEPYRSEHSRYIANYLRTGKKKIIGIGREVVGQRKDGSIFPMELGVSELRVSGRRLFTGMVRDVSARKRAEELSTRLGRIIEHSINEIYVFDAETLKFTLVNSGARENLGYAMDELRELTPLDLKPEFTRDEFEVLLEPLRQGTRPQVLFETLHKRKDGSTYDVEVRLQLMPTEAPPVFVAIIQDITYRRRIERELLQAQKMEAVGQLTGGVAHDFNNLLTVIMGNLEMLEARLEGDRNREILGQAQEAAGLGAQLTARLLAFARRQALEPRLIDLNQLVLGTSDLLQRTLGETIQVNSILAKDLWQTVADPGQVENVLLNLAINARDAMADGGALTIETANAHLDEAYAVSTTGVLPGDYVMLAVTDTGHGMTRAIQERAFEPFFTTKEAGTGTGLGLSMVYGFVRQSGGHVSLESEPGQGSTLRIYLPRTDGDLAVAEPGRVAEKTGSRGETILVVEDDERLRRVTVQRLSDLGYEALNAESGQTALSMLKDGAAIDLLFTDLIMPGGMNGDELAREARRLRPDLKVLFTSGYAEPAIIR